MYQYKLKDPDFLPHVGCDLDLALGSGDCLVLFGENGVGKSTLAQRIRDDLGASSVTLIEQTPLDHFYDRSLSTLKNIFFNMSSEKLDADFFHTFWHEAGLKDKESRMLSQLSGGENQALKLALGMSIRADILILDEPSQFLDQARKDLLRQALLKKMTGGSSVLIIEHDLQWLPPNLNVIQLEIREGILSKGKTWST